MLKRKIIIYSILGSAILAFGLYQIHSYSGVTEGGVLGLALLLYHWWGISPAVSGLVLNGACYALGLKVLGKKFIAYSLISGGCFSLFYAIFEKFPILFPQLLGMPLVASIAGALFVGVGIGLCVRSGSAPSGDDALAMSLEKLLTWPIERIYLISDLVVLALSLSYIPLSRIFYSLLTVVLSGQIIGWIERYECKKSCGV